MSTPPKPRPREVLPSEALVAELAGMGLSAGSYRLEPMSQLRRVMARRLTESAREIPHFPLLMQVHLGPLLELRSRRNEGGGARISVNDLVVRAAALALMEVPEANVSFTPEGLIFHQHADVAVAVAVEGGLVTPIVRAAETLSIDEISAALQDMAARGRRMRLRPEEYTGGTFTVSNLGMFGVTSFGSILNPPQACILSVGAAEERVVRGPDGFQAQTWMAVTLTCDHRAVDGAVGARLLQAFRALIEAPDALLG